MERKSLAVNGAFSLIAKVIAMLVPLFVYPYVMRVLGAENYGKVAYVEAFIGYFTLLAALGIDNYAQRECSVLRHDKILMTKKASQIFVIGLIMSFISFVIYLCCVFFVQEMRADYILYMIFSIMIFSNSISLNWLYAAQERFDLTSAREIVSKCTYLLLCFLLVKSSSDYIEYSAIVVFSTTLLPMLWNQYRIQMGECDIKPSFRESDGFHKCIKPIFYLALLTIGSKLFTDSDTLMIKWFINDNGDKAVGIYNSATILPKAFDTLLMAVSAVVTPQIFISVRNHEEEQVHYLMNKTTNILFFISVPAILTCLFFAKEMIFLFAGEEYLSGESVLQIYSFIIMGVLIITMAGTRTYIARQKERKLFVILLFGAVLNICLNVWFIRLCGINGAAIATLISYIVVMTIELTLEKTWHYVFTADKLKYLVGGMIISLIFFCVNTLMRDIIIVKLVVAISLAGIAYVTSMFLLKETSVRLLIEKIRSKK